MSPTDVVGRWLSALRNSVVERTQRTSLELKRYIEQDLPQLTRWSLNWLKYRMPDDSGPTLPSASVDTHQDKPTIPSWTQRVADDSIYALLSRNMNPNQPPNSSLPPSIGPGAHRIDGETRQAMVRNLIEARRTYRSEINPTTLQLSYEYHGRTRQYDISFDAIPLQGFSRWLLYGGRIRSRVTAQYTLDLIRGAENMAGRPLTQPEVEAFAFHSSKRMRYSFTGTIAGLATGYAVAARGSAAMKFPFRVPKPLEKYNHFPSAKFSILSGPVARFAWQMTRANLYAALGLILIGPLFRGMGESVLTVGLYRDSRTQEVVKLVKGTFDRIRLNTQLPQGSTQSGHQQQNQLQHQDQEGNSQEQENENDSSAAQSDYDKNPYYSGDTTFSDSSIDTGALDDSAMQQRESVQAPPAARSPAQPNKWSRRQPPQQLPSSASKQQESSDLFFDDASPTAGNDPNVDTPSSYSRQQTRGAWSRIRSENRRGSDGIGSAKHTTTGYSQSSSERARGDQSTWGQPDNSDAQGESFSFSNSEEDKELAKRQAQKEFDAMLERERRESSSGGYERSDFATESGREQAGRSGGSAWDKVRGR